MCNQNSRAKALNQEKKDHAIAVDKYIPQRVKIPVWSQDKNPQFVYDEDDQVFTTENKTYVDY